MYQLYQTSLVVLIWVNRSEGVSLKERARLDGVSVANMVHLYKFVKKIFKKKMDRENDEEPFIYLLYIFFIYLYD